jgi:hypothetical protein
MLATHQLLLLLYRLLLLLFPLLLLLCWSCDCLAEACLQAGPA